MAGQLFVNGHEGEARLVQALSRLTEISTIGFGAGKFWWSGLVPKDDSPGLKHELLLWDRKPELWHRWMSAQKLRQFYLEKTRREGAPDVVLVRNLQPVYNQFVKWLRRQPKRPPIVLFLGDSGGLGNGFPGHAGCATNSSPCRCWMMNRFCSMTRALCPGSRPALLRAARRAVGLDSLRVQLRLPAAAARSEPRRADPVRLFRRAVGTFRRLADGAAFSRAPACPALCMSSVMARCRRNSARAAKAHPEFHFDGFLPKPSDCPAWAQKVDVLINARLPLWGLDNSAPSKVFEYGVAGKAIISTRTAGMDEILGQHGIYVETDNFEDSLRQKLRRGFGHEPDGASTPGRQHPRGHSQGIQLGRTGAADG